MSQEPPDWKIIHCPACASPLKLPASVVAERLQCPKCQAPLRSKSTHGTAVAMARALPVTRNVAPPPKLRGEREAWEPGHPAMKEVSFQVPVSRIGADVPIVDEPAPEPVRRGRRMDRPDWEKDAEEDAEPPPLPPPGKKRLGLVLAVSTAACAAVALVAVTILNARQPVAPPVAPAPAAAVVATRGSSSGGDTANAPKILLRGVPEEEYDAVQAFVERYLATDTVPGLLALVRDPDRVRPAIEAHYARHPLKASRLQKFPARTDVMHFGTLYSGFIEVDDFDRRLFALQKTDDGLRMDWEAYMAWCEVPWEDLPEKKPTTPVVMRASIRLDDYFNFDYNDSQALACFRLSSLWGDHAVYAYLPKKNPLYETLRRRCQASPLVLGVVKIRYREGATQPDQVDLTEFVCNGWVLGGAAEAEPALPPAPGADPAATSTAAGTEPGLRLR